MTLRLRWKIGLAVAAVLGPIVAGLVAAPSLVDLEAYKPGMVEAVRDATGRELVIDGPMKLSVFPVPGIGAGQVHFSNPVGAKGAQMIDVQWVAVTPSWRALLHGHIAVGTLRFYRPTIALETDANGRPNWEFPPGAGAKQAANAPSAGLHLAIGRLELVDGKVTYTDPATHTSFAAENVRGGATVSSLDGPFEIDGKGTVNGVPLKLDVSVGPDSPQGHATKLSLEVSSGKLDFKGTVSALTPDATVRGHLAVSTGVLSDFVNSIVSATGAPKPSFDTSGAGPFTFSGDVLVSPDRIAADKFDIEIGKDDVAGSLALALTPAPALTGNVRLSRLDLGRWLDILSRPIDFTPEPVKQAAPQAVAAAPSTLAALNADVDVSIGETHFQHDVIKQLEVHLQASKGQFSLPHLKAVLPGDMKLDADAPAGRFSLAGNDLRHTLKWLDVDTEGVPAGKLKTLKVEGKLASAPGRFDVSDGTFMLDQTAGTIGGTLFLKTPVVAQLHAEMDQFDLESYRPKAADTDQTAATPPADATPPPPPAVDPTAPKVELKLKIGKLPFRGQTLSGVDGDLAVQGDRLQLASVTIADVVGAKLHISGAIDDFGTAPRFNLAFDVAAPDTDRLLDYATLPKFLNGSIGPSTAKGRVVGSSSFVHLHEVAASFLNTDAQLSGTLAFRDPVAYDFPKFFLHTRDASALVSAASGTKMNSVGYIRATGSLGGTTDAATFSGELRARGSRLTGKLDTTLDKHPKIVATFKDPGVFKVDRWLGIDPKSAAHIAPIEDAPESTPTPTTPQPIDLAALRAFDVRLSLQANTMTLATLKVENASIEASMVNGVAKVSKLDGAYYGGAAVFAGTVDASGNALSVDMTGNVRGIAIDQLLKGTLGKNTLSSSGFAVAVGGKADATGMRITGKGASSQEIRNALTGAAAISGAVQPVITEGSPAFARFATSIGSIFSSGLAFDSQVLRSFIDRSSPLSGRFELSAGGFAMKNLTVQGDNAMATIDGRANFTDDSLDTTVTLVSGNSRYVTTVKGPAASPDLNTTRTSGR